MSTILILWEKLHKILRKKCFILQSDGELKIGLSLVCPQCCPSLERLFQYKKVVQVQEGRPTWKHLDDLPTLEILRVNLCLKAYNSDHVLLF